MYSDALFENNKPYVSPMWLHKIKTHRKHSLANLPCGPTRIHLPRIHFETTSLKHMTPLESMMGYIAFMDCKYMTHLESSFSLT
jgi:hypothetical protein